MGKNCSNFTLKQIKSSCYLIIMFILLTFVLDNSVARELLSYEVYVILKTFFWSAIGCVIHFFLPQNGHAGKLKYSGQLNLWAFNCAAIYIGILIISGVIVDLGSSPYDQSAAGVLYNILTIGTVLVSTEFIRSYLVNGLFKKEKYSAFLFLAVLMTLPQLRLSSILQISDWVEFSIWICEDFGPVFCQSFLATYLCFLGGATPAIIYMSMVNGFHWLSPVLPDLPWLITGLIGIMVPIFQMTFISGIYLKLNKTIKEYKSPKESFAAWVATCLTTITLLWFVIGVFPIYPSVIATGSMEPVIYPGDMILINKVTTLDEIKALKVGDIIHFKRDDMMICHRINRIIEEEGVLYFETKGDNNPSEDSTPVKVEHIKGTIVKVLPKVGWPSLALKLVGNHSTEPVEF